MILFKIVKCKVKECGEINEINFNGSKYVGLCRVCGSYIEDKMRGDEEYVKEIFNG